MVSFPAFINICVTENGCKVDITRKNIYNYCNVNLTFGGTMKNRIKELREQRGLTQEQLGELVGVSRQAINAIETEKFEPSIWLAYIVLRASKEETMKRAIERSKLDRETNIELVETMLKQFSNLGIYELNVIDTTTHSIKDTVSAVKEKIVSGTALLF